MPFQAVPDVAQVDLEYLMNNVPASNTLYFFESDGSWTQDDVDELAGIVEAWYASDAAALQHDEMSLDRIVVKSLDEEFGPQAILNPGLAGSRGAAGIPNNVALGLVFPTVAGGAPRKGSIFFPGGLDGDFAELGPSQAYRDACIAAFDELRATAAAAGYVQHAVSRYQGFTLVERPNGTVVKKPTPRNPALSRAVTSTVASGFVWTQRGRVHA